jgi:hypothetical protein
MSDLHRQLEAALRYGAYYTHADFHRKLRESVGPTVKGAVDRTAHGVYADWLVENGMPATGEAISKGMTMPAGNSPHNNVPKGLAWHVRLTAHQQRLPADFHVERLNPDGGWGNGDRIYLSAKDQTDPENHYFHWELPVPAGEGLSLLKRMRAEGVTMAHSLEQQLKAEERK